MVIPTRENHIPILNPIPWVWGSILGHPYGDPHGDSYINPVGMEVSFPRLPWENHKERHQTWILTE